MDSGLYSSREVELRRGEFFLAASLPEQTGKKVVLLSACENQTDIRTSINCCIAFGLVLPITGILMHGLLFFALPLSVVMLLYYYYYYYYDYDDDYYYYDYDDDDDYYYYLLHLLLLRLLLLLLLLRRRRRLLPRLKIASKP